MKRLRSGFTLVELIVVIATIGILATITVIGLTRYQADTRDAKRAASVSVISEALEKYYDENGEYPSCTDVMAAASTLTQETLVGVSASAVKAPQAPSGQTNSIECEDISIDGTDLFEYEGDGSPACTGSTACLSYTLKYKEESSGQIKSLTSRRNTSIATSGAPTISISTTDFASITVQWTETSNASSYLVQRSSSASFTSPQDEKTVSAPNLSAVMDGLSTASTYFFRVRPNATGSTGNWSNTVSATTLNIANPVCTATANSNSQITVNWGAVTNATEYNFQYSLSPSMTSPNTTLGITGTSRVVTGLATGVTYYFQVQAVNASYSSSWSSVCQATTFVPAPSSLAAVTNSSTQITATWSSVSVATSYTIQYGYASDFSGTLTTVTGITGTTHVATGLQQGRTHYFRVYALVGATSSVASPTASATTTITAPTGVSVSANDTGSVRAYAAGDWIQWNDSPSSGNWYYAWGTGSGSCPSGSTRQFRFGANYTSPTTFLGWTGWETTSTKYRTSPYSGYGVRFHVEARCVGPSGVISSTVSSSSGYVY
jgi:prepilin-type N-terminal cleavage/methylation domain-containing protein